MPLDSALISQLIEKAKSADVKKWLGQLNEATDQKAKATKQEALKKKLTEYNNIPTQNVLKPGVSEDVYMHKYFDSQLVLPFLKGEKTALTNANVNAANAARMAANAAFRARVATRKAANTAARKEKASMKTQTQKAQKAVNAFEKAKARKEGLAIPKSKASLEKEEKAAAEEARFAVLRATKGRNANKEALIEEAIMEISLDKPSKTIDEIIRRIRSQKLRFSPTLKKSTLKFINEQIDSLESDIIAADALITKGKTPKVPKAELENKLSAFESLKTLVVLESPVKLSNATKKASKGVRGESKGPMSCRILHHPCNPKIRITKEQLKTAADNIMLDGTAPRIPKSEMIEQGPSSTKTSSAIPSAATSAAVAPNNELQKNY